MKLVLQQRIVKRSKHREKKNCCPSYLPLGTVKKLFRSLALCFVAEALGTEMFCAHQKGPKTLVRLLRQLFLVMTFLYKEWNARMSNVCVLANLGSKDFFFMTAKLRQCYSIRRFLLNLISEYFHGSIRLKFNLLRIKYSVFCRFKHRQPSRSKWF